VSKLFTIDSPEDLDAPLEFLYYLYILSNNASPLPPPVRLIISAAQAGDYIGTEASKFDVARGPRRFSGAMTTPEILAYEHSALGSTRII
tara:strand:- start:1626 stop:1895 length:270 start_codon:yes stop_codon:yes gene_type:complete